MAKKCSARSSLSDRRLEIASPKSALAALRELQSKIRDEDRASDDMIVGSMRRTVQTMLAIQSAVAGGQQVDLGGGVIVTLDCEGRDWKARLAQLDALAQSIAQSVRRDARVLRWRLLRADGWVVNDRTLKTPAWFKPHVEVELQTLAGLGLGWVNDAL